MSSDLGVLSAEILLRLTSALVVSFYRELINSVCPPPFFFLEKVGIPAKYGTYF